MKDRPSPTHELFDEMHHVVAARLAGNASLGQECRLKELIRQDIDACDLYLDMVFESSALLTWAKDDEPDEGPARPLPLLTFFGTSIHGTVGYFSSGWPLAYLIATLIFGTGLIIGSLVPVSQPVQVAHQFASLPSPLSPLSSMVGRISGMVDCKWERSGVRGQGSGAVVSGQWSVASGQNKSDSISTSHQSLATGHLVALGDRFALASGLMEITYDTGAKVILQGPVTYELESAAGGYLSVGKLTARLEKNDKCGTLNAERSASSSAFIVQPSSFIVRTPTATVTDLGTEFSVEVSREGKHDVQVFVGMVKVQLPAEAGGKPREIRLTGNQAVRFGAVSNKVTYHAAAPERFVRRLERPEPRVIGVNFTHGDRSNLEPRSGPAW